MRVAAPDERRNRRLLLAFLIAALALRLPGHLDSGLWYDEIWLLVESIRVPFGTLFTSFESDNNHPFYSVLTWLGVQAFGEHAWTLRLPALVFGVASIGVMWKLALSVTGRAEAALATTLLTVSYHHVWFSQNARGYTMLLFWTLAATYYLIRTYEGAGRRAWIPYAVCMALATYTHASAVLVALAHGLVSLVVLARSRGTVRDAIAAEGQAVPGTRFDALLGLGLAGAISLALHAGMLGDMLDFFAGSAAEPSAGYPSQPAEMGPSQWTTLYWTVAAVVDSLGVPAPVGWAALLGGGALLGAGLWVTFRRNWMHALLYVTPGVLAVGATVALGRSLRPRFLFHLGGFALLILAAGLFAVCALAARLARAERRESVERGLRWTAAALTVAASLAILPRAYTLPKQDFEGALEYVEAERRDDVVVATAGLTDLPYRSYYGQDFPDLRSVEDLESLLDRAGSVLVLHTIPIYLEATAPRLAERLAGAREVARFRGSLGDGDVVVLRLERADDGR